MGFVFFSHSEDYLMMSKGVDLENKNDTDTIYVNVKIKSIYQY